MNLLFGAARVSLPRQERGNFINRHPRVGRFGIDGSDRATLKASQGAGGVVDLKIAIAHLCSIICMQRQALGHVVPAGEPLNSSLNIVSGTKKDEPFALKNAPVLEFALGHSNRPGPTTRNSPQKVISCLIFWLRIFYLRID